MLRGYNGATMEARVQAYFWGLITSKDKRRPPRLTRQRIGEVAHQAALKALDEDCRERQRPLDASQSDAFFHTLNDIKAKYLTKAMGKALVHGHDALTLYRATEAAFTEIAAIEDDIGEPCAACPPLWESYQRKELDSNEAYGLFLQVIYYLRKHGSDAYADRLRAALDARPLVLQ